MSLKRRYQPLPKHEDPPIEQNTEFDSKKESPKPGFDLTFFKRFWTITVILYTFAKKWMTLGVTLILLAVAMGNVYVISWTGNVTSGFVDALLANDRGKFKDVLILSAVVITLSALLDSTIKFLVEWLAFCWRRTLCFYIQELYFLDLLFYKVVAFDGRIDNPDQRITQDVDKFSTSLSLALSGCVTAPLTIILYTVRTASTIGWFAPVIVTSYFIIGYIANKNIMGYLAKLVASQEQLEGDFRFDHIRVRTCAESIAIYDGGEREKNNAEKTFLELLRNQMKIMRWHWGLNASSNLIAYVGSILNYVIVAIPVFYVSNGFDASATNILLASFNCIMLISGFSQFSNVSEQMSDVAGYTTRLASMIEILQELKTKHKKKDDEDLSTEAESDLGRRMEDKDECIQFQEVTCYTPTGIKLVNNLTLTVERGMNLLITGPSGSGKSSILRILNGIWPFYEGTIVKPPAEGHCMFYLPQKPYLFHGTLKEQIIYPRSVDSQAVIVEKDELSDDQLFEFLSLVNLTKLLQRFKSDQKVNWTDVLSPGEQQLLSFARLLYHQPKFAVLDEATSSLHEEIEYYLYDICTKREITLVSVGHRSSLRSFHSHLLEIDENHQWSLSSLSK